MKGVQSVYTLLSINISTIYLSHRTLLAEGTVFMKQTVLKLS